MKLVLVAALLAAGAYAECANGCSGHGFCGVQDKCSCFRNYQGNDCSLRTCPFDVAYVDLPLGDLNMNGELDAEPVALGAHTNVHYGHEVWPTDPLALRQGSVQYDQPEVGHHYAECSNKGSCDRKSGTCDCMDGFEGTACRRTVCPENCSGHGTCETMQAMAENRMTKGASGKYCEGGALSPKQATGNLHTTGNEFLHDDLTHLCATEYTLWDRYKAQVCKCDPGYFGIDCSARHCPHGDDPLTTGQSDETQWVDIWASSVMSGSFRLTFEDEFGETWDTMPIDHSTFAANGAYEANTGFRWEGGEAATENVNLAARVEAALEGIPNGVIGDVTVVVDAADFPLPGVISARADTDPKTATVNTAADKLGRSASQAMITNEAWLARVNGVGAAAANIGNTRYITNCQSGSGHVILDQANAGAVQVVETDADSFQFTSTAASDGTAFAVGNGFCYAYRYGFRLKVTFNSNPGDIHSLGVDASGTTTADGLAVNSTGGDILRFVGGVGHGDSGDGTKNTILATGEYSQHISPGDRLLVPGKVASDAVGATADKTMILTVSAVAGIKTDDGTADADANNNKITVNEDIVWDTAVDPKSDGSQGATFTGRVWGLYGRGTTENVECSHRGLCNHDDGLCECFAGYTNNACDVQNALNA